MLLLMCYTSLESIARSFQPIDIALDEHFHLIFRVSQIRGNIAYKARGEVVLRLKKLLT